MIDGKVGRDGFGAGWKEAAFANTKEKTYKDEREQGPGGAGQYGEHRPGEQGDENDFPIAKTVSKCSAWNLHDGIPEKKAAKDDPLCRSAQPQVLRNTNDGIVNHETIQIAEAPAEKQENKNNVLEVFAFHDFGHCVTFFLMNCYINFFVGLKLQDEGFQHNVYLCIIIRTMM